MSSIPSTRSARASCVNVVVNGSTEQLAAGITVAALLERLDLVDQRLAVEVNEEVVPRSRFCSHQLSDGDHVEIVHAIGGG